MHHDHHRYTADGMVTAQFMMTFQLSICEVSLLVGVSTAVTLVL